MTCSDVTLRQDVWDAMRENPEIGPFPFKRVNPDIPLTFFLRAADIRKQIERVGLTLPDEWSAAEFKAELLRPTPGEPTSVTITKTRKLI